MSGTQPRSWTPGRPWAVALLLFVIVGIPFLVIFGWSFISEARYFHQQRQYEIISPALGLAYKAESYKTAHGRYPQSEKEFRSFQGEGKPLIEEIVECSRRFECPLERVVVPERRGEEQDSDSPILVFTGEGSRIEIYRAERIGVSQCFITRRGFTPPEWLDILPDGPSQAE